MSNYTSLKATVNANIKTNNNQEITGAILNSVLNEVINSLGADYQFAGIAATSTNPGTPDQRVFYLAGAGTFTYFGGTTISQGSLGVFYYDSSWHYQTIAMVVDGSITSARLASSAVTSAKIADGAVTTDKLASALSDLLFKTGYKYEGVALPSTNPGTPSQDVFYLAGAGTYPYFGNVTIEEGYLGVLAYHNAAWSSATIKVGKDVEIVNNLYEGGAEKALSAEMGKELREMFGYNNEETVFFENSSSVSWVTGNIFNGGLNNSPNQRYIFSLPQHLQGAEQIKVTLAADQAFNLKVCTSASPTSGFSDDAFLLISSGEQTATIDFTGKTYIGLVVYDNPTQAEAQAMDFSISAILTSDSYVLRNSDVVNNLEDGGETKVLSAEMGKELKEILDGLTPPATTRQVWTAATGEWITGNINIPSLDTSNYANKMSFIPVPDDMRVTGKFRVTKTTSSFHINVFLADDRYNITSCLSEGDYTLDQEFSVGNSPYIVILLWNQPSEEQCRAESITVSTVFFGVVSKGEVDASENTGIVPSQYSFIDLKKRQEYVHLQNISYGQGGMDGETGALTSNGRITGLIGVQNGDNIYVKHSCPFGFSYVLWLYDSTGAAVRRLYVKDEYTPIAISLPTDRGFIRFNIYNPSGMLVAATDATMEMTNLQVWIPKRYNTNAYNNPLIPNVDLPDPAIWDGEDGYWYMLATNNTTSLETAPFYRSRNMVEWELVGFTPWTTDSISDIRTALGGDYYWAATMFKVSADHYVMILGKPSDKGLGFVFLTSSHPTYGFTYNKVVTNGEGARLIDAAFAFDETGKLWLFAGDNKIWIREMNANGVDFAEGSSWQVVAGTGTTSGSDKLEGCMPYKRNGWWYLFLSSAAYANATYHLVCVRSRSINGSYVNKEGVAATTSGGYTDVLTTADLSVSPTSQYLYGAGHCAEIWADKRNKTWLLYHSHYYGGGAKRALCLDELVWDEGQGSVFFENSSSIQWETGNILNGELAVYANQRYIFAIPQNLQGDKIKVSMAALQAFNLKVCVSTSATTGFVDAGFLTISSKAQEVTIDITGMSYIGLVAYDKPSQAQAQALDFTISESSEAWPVARCLHPSVGGEWPEE